MTTTSAHTNQTITGKYLDDLSPGDYWITEGRTVTESDLITFGTWSGDMNPLHSNEEFAKTTQFGQRIFHGPGALSIAFGLEMKLGWKTGTAIAFLGIDNWKMVNAVFLGDTLHVTEEITVVKPSSSKPDRGVVTSHVRILNQRDELIQEGDWVVMISRRSDEVTQ